MAIFTAIGVGLFGAGTLMAGISAAALQVAAGLALNYFAASLNGQPEQQAAGMQGQLQVGAEVSRTVNIGLGLAEHSLVYANYWGDDGKTPNAYLTQVFCLGDYPVKSLAEFYVDGVKVGFSGAQTADGLGRSLDQYRRDGKDHAWVKFYDGTQTAADTFLVSKFGGHPERPYQASRVGFGCPYVVVTTLVNDELWNGWPAIKAVLSGARLYDVSRDSTRGGNGAQRVDQPGTWGGDGDDLTAVQAYALLRGFRFEGQWLYGLQNLPLAQLPDAWWVSQINACRATVLGPGGQEPTYRSGGSLAVSRPISDAITDLVTSCQGHIVEVGGEYRLHVGVAKTPVFHITDGDVFSTEERRFTPFFGLAETINGISATHPSPESGWNILPLPTLLRPDLETIDGNRRLTAAVSLDLVPYEWQAQRIMQSALEEARRERQLTIALPGSFYLALPGEWITFTSAANGFVQKLFRIDGSADRDDGHVLWDITEIDPTDYDPDFATYVPPVDGSLQPGNVPVQTIVAWAVTPDSIKDDLGRPRRPAVRFHWDPDIEDVRAVGFQLRTASGLDLVLDESFDNVQLGSIALASARILANQELQGRGRYYSSSGRVPQEWTGWLPVVTPSVFISDLDLTPELKELFDDTQEWLDEGLPALNTTLATIDAEFTALETTVGSNFTSLTSSIGVVQAQVNDVFAADAWVNSKTYPKEDIVQYSGALYRAKMAVPVNIVPTNATYWERIGSYTGLGAAVAGSFTLINSEVSRIDGVNASQGTSITALNNALPGKADASAVTSLATRVTETENTNSSQGTAITGLNNSLTTTNTNVATAQSAAEAAATLAGGKGKVLVQSTAPAAADRNGVTLWIDTTGGNNTPKRWTSGTTWGAVTDKVATDAAAAASAAMTAVALKADASTVSTLSNTVSQQGTDISAQGTAITGIQTSIGGISGSGVNLLSDIYSWLTSATLPPVAGNQATVAGIAIPAPLSASGFGYLLTSTSGTIASWVAMAPANSNAGRNIDFTPGTYIVSAYMSSSAVNQLVRPQFYSTSGTGAISVYGTSKLVPQGTRTRIDWEMVVTGTGRASLLWYFNMHAGPVTDELTMDSVMIERKAGSATSSAPSPFVAGPSAQAIGGLASAQSALDARVSAAEGVNTAQGTSITGLTTSLAGKADASALASLDTKVTAQGDNITSTSKDVRKISNSLMAAAMLNFEQGAGQAVAQADTYAASASVMEYSKSEVSRINGVTTAVSESVSALQAAVGTNLGEAISQVALLVTEQAAQGTQIDSLRVVIGTGEASYLAKTEVIAAPSGFVARHAMRLQATAPGGDLVQVSVFFDIDANGKTRIGFSADDTVFFDASGNAIALIGGDGKFRSANGAYQVDMITGDVIMTRGVIRSDDSKFLMSPSLKRLSIST